jgi:hypothetical protein
MPSAGSELRVVSKAAGLKAPLSESMRISLSQALATAPSLTPIAFAAMGTPASRVEEQLDEKQQYRGLSFAPERHIVCPWHGWEFDIATGLHPGDSRMRLKRVKVEVRDGDIYVEAPDRR